MTYHGNLMMKFFGRSLWIGAMYVRISATAVSSCVGLDFANFGISYWRNHVIKPFFTTKKRKKNSSNNNNNNKQSKDEK